MLRIKNLQRDKEKKEKDKGKEEGNKIKIRYRMINEKKGGGEDK